MTLEMALLYAARVLVPRAQRPDWFAEWKAELDYVSENAESAARSFCCGAFRDALWLRRNSLPAANPAAVLASPWRCIALLAALAAAAVFLPLRPLVASAPQPQPIDPAKTAGVCLVLGLAIALLIASRDAILRGIESLPEAFGRPMIRLDLGLSPRLRLQQPPPDGTGARRLPTLRCWVFLAAKSVLLVLIVVFGSLRLGPPADSGIFLWHILVFRWALADQRQRCPICLRRLINPTRIGEPSHTFLDWYGTEFMCERGHGLLHVPEIRASSYNMQRWLRLDPSWSSLFPAGVSGRPSV